MRVWASIIALFLGASSPLIASACSFDFVSSLFPDKRIVIQADGSFDDAAVDDVNLVFLGKPIVDLGNDRVGQRIVEGGGCAARETLLVVNCKTLEMIKVFGIYDNSKTVEIAGFDDLPIDPILYPQGPIRLSKMDVPEIASVAQRSGFEFTLDVDGDIQKMKKRNRYNPLFGCKLFYPDSAGAQN